MGAFSGLKSASRGYNSNTVREDCELVVRIDECSFFDTEASGEKWKNSLTILAVVSGEGFRVGETVHTFFNVSAGKQVFQRNLKGFLAGVLDVTDDEIGEDEAKVAVSEESPMKGLVTVLRCRMKTSQKTKDDDGNPVNYPVYAWTPCLDSEAILDAIGEEAVERFFPNGL